MKKQYFIFLVVACLAAGCEKSSTVSFSDLERTTTTVDGGCSVRSIPSEKLGLTFAVYETYGELKDGADATGGYGVAFGSMKDPLMNDPERTLFSIYKSDYPVLGSGKLSLEQLAMIHRSFPGFTTQDAMVGGVRAIKVTYENLPTTKDATPYLTVEYFLTTKDQKSLQISYNFLKDSNPTCNPDSLINQISFN